MRKTKERAASIKETGEELPPEQWKEFEAAAEATKSDEHRQGGTKAKSVREPSRGASPKKGP